VTRSSAGRRAPLLWSLALLLLSLLLGLAACGRGEEGAGARRPANRLARESSPYLLLHAKDPVDWYPWGEEAFARARQEGKPIFLSVGYFSCYWCHVMEREVFSKPAMAELLNRWFVAVKVDREERPDVDEIYIAANEALTGSPGWPNNLFLTPDLKPFWAGTYLPPEDRAGSPGFRTVLTQVHEGWEGHRAALQATAEQVAGAVRASLAASRAPTPPTAAPPSPPPTAAAERAKALLMSQFQPATGGFGGPPRFPSPGNLFFLWEAAERGDAAAREMVLVTLRKMGQGAIYDQLGGGFHRYTLDAEWRLPHFEKMLYDNALLAEVLTLTVGASPDPDLARLARGTLDFLLAEMATPEGGFRSAVDAETDGEEGAYYVWRTAELRRVLREADFRFLAPLFGFDGPPNLPGDRRTLYLPLPLSAQAGRLGLSPEDLHARMDPLLEKLRAARARRKPPRIDDKVLADWNGMAIAAFARAGKVFGEPRYTAAATRAADFALHQLHPGGGPLLHAYRAGAAKVPAFLDDYAYLIRGLLALAEVSGEPRWGDEAERLAAEMEERLRDPQGGYTAAAPDPRLLFQSKTVTDGAVPAGNAIAILDLLALSARTGKPVYRDRAASALRAFAPDLDRYPVAVPTLALAVLRFHGQSERHGMSRPP
jgi:uncharacterized protein YyaL (SSP411 family)